MIMKLGTETSISEDGLQGLFKARAVRTIEATPSDDGTRFEILINGQFYLQSQRQPRRRFSSLDTLARYLVERWGVETVTVHFVGWRRQTDK
ncbi:hypothetical protein [Burkholderia ubonensis]|uniref:hypothetical protein n=1 Tax=Burkholderia ubonensis TaxID=101571 RepID=UPI000ABE3F2B|nr:hypothetical protein [Burkholderia ubonensis]